MKKKGRASDYSNVKDYPKFGSFVRAVIGLPFVPLDRMDEAVAIIKNIGRANSGARRIFCKSMLKYLDDTWLNGAIPRRVWNMFQHRGVTTNNHAEVSIAHDDGK